MRLPRATTRRDLRSSVSEEQFKPTRHKAAVAAAASALPRPIHIPAWRKAEAVGASMSSIYRLERGGSIRLASARQDPAIHSVAALARGTVPERMPGSIPNQVRDGHDDSSA